MYTDIINMVSKKRLVQYKDNFNPEQKMFGIFYYILLLHSIIRKTKCISFER